MPLHEREQQIRPTGDGGPFGAAPSGWPAPPGWTCDAGSHVASLACGCWVDTCASLCPLLRATNRARQVAATARSRRERSGAARAAPGVTVEDRCPTRQSTPGRSRKHLGQAAIPVPTREKALEFTYWMPVDRVLRCPGSDGTGVGASPRSRATPAASATLREASRTDRGRLRPVAFDFVHRVWTYLWTRTE